MEVRLVDGAVAEERNCHCPVALELRRERGSGRSSDRPTDDAEAADDAVREVDDVHRAAAAAVGSGLASEELTEQGGLVDAHRETGAVPAIRGGDRVAGPEQVAHSDCDRLLALVQMGGSLDLVVEEEAVHHVLELPDANHALVEALEVGRTWRLDDVCGLCRHASPCVLGYRIVDSGSVA